MHVLAPVIKPAGKVMSIVMMRTTMLAATLMVELVVAKMSTSTFAPNVNANNDQ